MLTKSGWNSNRAVKGLYDEGYTSSVCYVKTGPTNIDGEYYDKYNNRCATEIGASVGTTINTAGRDSLERCQEECSWDEDCNAVEWYPTKKTNPCLHIITYKLGNVATRALIGVNIDGAECYVKKRLKTLCHADTCADVSREHVNVEGKCALCDNYSKPSADQKKCIYPECNERQSLTVLGMCEYCPPYTRRIGSIHNDCKADDCSPHARLLVDGTCIECPEYSVVSGNKRYCYEPACGSRSRLLNTGICETCPPNTRASIDQRRCDPADCESDERLTIEGICVRCPSYTVPSNDKTSCTHNECTNRQKHLTNGSCEDCPDYERTQLNGHDCGPNECNVPTKVTLSNASWLDTDGASSGADKAIDGSSSSVAKETSGSAG